MVDIADKFVDETSKKLWELLHQQNETGDYENLIKAHRLSGIISDEIYIQHQRLLELKERGKYLIYYGLGTSAEWFTELEEKRKGTPGYINFPFLGDVPWDAFCDQRYQTYVHGFMGKEVISPERCYEKARLESNVVIVIGSKCYYEEIRNELRLQGIPEENIEPYIWPNTKCYEERQYFDTFLEPQKEDIVIDGGCFRCDTIERFINWNKSCGYKKVISFEPDQKNYDICMEITKAKKWENVEILHAGLADTCQMRRFVTNGDDTSMFDKNGDSEVELKSIDSVVEGEKVSFIKLDVEGFELAALSGASQTIRKWHPRMAVSLYHKQEDIKKIPEYISSLWDGYNFYLRIYSNAYLEIVLYAV